MPIGSVSLLPWYWFYAHLHHRRHHVVVVVVVVVFCGFKLGQVGLRTANTGRAFYIVHVSIQAQYIC